MNAQQPPSTPNPATPSITVTQAMVDAIIERAKASNCGLEEPDKGPGSYDISQYAPQSLHSLAIMLVSAHHSKWDIISVMTAALEEIATPTQPEALP